MSKYRRTVCAFARGGLLFGFFAAFLLCALAAMLAMCVQSSAKGGSPSREQPYNPRHVDNLPAEIRAAVVHGCSAPKAQHYLAGYRDNARQVVLHFEYLSCNGGSVRCSAAGCLHQVYVFTGGRYRLVRRYYARARD